MFSVAELIKKLETYNQDSLVLLAKDAEGNDYSSLDDLSVELVETDYDGGHVVDLFDQESLLEEDPDRTAVDIKNNFKEVVVFWPV